ncbi:MAG: thioredoxin family protein, partial [Pseudomonadota bacterium]
LIFIDDIHVWRCAGGKSLTHRAFFVHENQTLVYQGAIDDNRSANPATVAGAKNYVTAALADLDAGRPVATAETAPYGCSVKYKS